MKLGDGTKTSIVALKRGDAEVCLLDVDGNQVVVTFKKALLIPSYLYSIFSVKVITTNGVAVIFKENKNELRHKSSTKFKIHIQKTVLLNNHGGLSDKS